MSNDLLISYNNTFSDKDAFNNSVNFIAEGFLLGDVLTEDKMVDTFDIKKELVSEYLTNVRYFEGNETSSKIVIYDLFSVGGASTSLPAWEVPMVEEFKKIILNCSTEEIDDEPAEITLAMKGFIENYGNQGFEMVRSYIINQALYSNVYLISNIMEMLGDVDSPSSYVSRRRFLESNLKSNTIAIRYGAVLGLANATAKESSMYLEVQLKIEDSKLVAYAIQAALDLFRR